MKLGGTIEMPRSVKGHLITDCSAQEALNDACMGMNYKHYSSVR